MKLVEQTQKPSKIDQLIASESYQTLISAIDSVKSEQAEIKIDEITEKIKVPLSALKLLGDVLKAMSQGNLFSLVPVASELTTQEAAEILGCSRPHLVKLLENGTIPFTKVGKHRRLTLEDILQYRNEMKARQKQHIIDIMNADDETGLYDS